MSTRLPAALVVLGVCIGCAPAVDSGGVDFVGDEIDVDAPARSIPAHAPQSISRADGVDESLLAWNDYGDVRAMRIGTDGQTLDEYPLVVARTKKRNHQPGVAYGPGGYLVLFHEQHADETTSNENTHRLRVVTLDPATGVLGAPITIAEGTIGHVALAWGPEGYLATWTEHSDDPRLVARRLDRTGAPLAPSFVVVDAQPSQWWCDVALAFDGAVFIVAWSNSCERWTGWLSYLRLSPTGDPIDAAPISLGAGAGARLATAHGVTMMTWTRYIQTDITDYAGGVLAARFVDSIPSAPFGFDTNAAMHSGEPQIIALDEDFLLAWGTGWQGGTDSLSTARLSPEGIVGPATQLPLSGSNGRALTLSRRDGGALVVWYEEEQGVGARASTLSLGPDLAPVPASERPLFPAAAEQAFPAVTFAGDHHLLVWKDLEQRGDATIRAQRLTAAGEPIDDTAFTISAVPGHQTLPAVAAAGPNALVVWQDHRAPGCPPKGSWGWVRPCQSDVYAARVRSSGGVLEPEGIPVAPLGDRWAGAPAVAFDGEGYVVAWHEGSGLTDNTPYRIYARTVDPEGRVGEDISELSGENGGVRPALACSNGACLVSWTGGVANEDAPSSSGYGNVWIRLVGSGAEPIGAPQRLEAGWSTSPATIATGADMFLVVWSGTEEDDAVLAVRVGTDGTVLDETPLRIGNHASYEGIGATFDGDSFLVAWKPEADTKDEMSLVRVTPEGAILADRSAPAATRPVLSSSGDGASILAYSRLVIEAPFGAVRVRARLITASPDPAQDDETVGRDGCGCQASSRSGPGAGLMLVVVVMCVAVRRRVWPLVAMMAACASEPDAHPPQPEPTGPAEYVLQDPAWTDGEGEYLRLMAVPSGFAATWYDSRASAGSYTRTLDFEGAPLGPSARLLPSGVERVVWAGGGFAYLGPSYRSTWTSRWGWLAPDGQPSSAHVEIDVHSSHATHYYALTGDDDGALVAWYTDRVVLAAIASKGQVGAPIELGVFDDRFNLYLDASAAHGARVVAWSDGDGAIWSATIRADGSVVTPASIVASTEYAYARPTVGPTKSGFVVIFARSNDEMGAIRLDARGVPIDEQPIPWSGPREQLAFDGERLVGLAGVGYRVEIRAIGEDLMPTVLEVLDGYTSDYVFACRPNACLIGSGGSGGSPIWVRRPGSMAATVLTRRQSEGFNPAGAAGGDLVLVAWKDDRSPEFSPPRYRIFSRDGRPRMEASVPVPPSLPESRVVGPPAVAWDGARWFVSWEEAGPMVGDGDSAPDTGPGAIRGIWIDQEGRTVAAVDVPSLAVYAEDPPLVACAEGSCLVRRAGRLDNVVRVDGVSTQMITVPGLRALAGGPAGFLAVSKEDGLDQPINALMVDPDGIPRGEPFPLAVPRYCMEVATSASADGWLVAWLDQDPDFNLPRATQSLSTIAVGADGRVDAPVLLDQSTNIKTEPRPMSTAAGWVVVFAHGVSSYSGGQNRLRMAWRDGRSVFDSQIARFDRRDRQPPWPLVVDESRVWILNDAIDDRPGRDVRRVTATEVQIPIEAP